MIVSMRNGLTVAVCISLCFVLHVVECKSSLQRKICSKYNYCGDAECKDGTLNYARATGPDDVLHYAWSTTGYPSLFISRSPWSNNTSENCLSNFHVLNYTSFNATQQPGSVSIDGTSTNFSFALIFKNLIEFKVSAKKLQAAGAFDPEFAHNCSISSENRKDCYNVYQLNNTHLNWSSYNPSEGLRARDSNGSLILHLKVTPRDDEDYEHDYAPKPWYTANSTTFDLLIKHFQYNLSKDNSRLALEIELVQGRKVADVSELDEKYSKDDEYTPSIFFTKYFSFGGRQGHGHVRWKPISYITHHRKSSESQQINVRPWGSVNNTVEPELPGSLARAIFNNTYSKRTRIYLVFGTAKDDGGLNSGLYTWTGSMGYGDQPDEPFSTLVILVIVIGLGIPAALTILAIGFVISLNIYKWHKSRRGYSRI